MADSNEIRVNLVLRRDRDGRLFEQLAQVLTPVAVRDRAEVLRRELSVWMEVATIVRSKGLSDSIGGVPVTSGTAHRVATVPDGDDAPDISRGNVKGASSGKLDMSQLNGIEMELDFMSPPR